MNGFAEHIEKTYKLPLSAPDQESLEQSSAEDQLSLQKRIERKYQISANILQAIHTPPVEKTVRQLLQQSPQIALKSFTRIQELLQLKEASYLDNDLFEKYHQKVINRARTYSKLLELVNQAKDESFSPEEFQKYLKSGLFDQGIYTLRRGPSQEELQEALDTMRVEIYEKYQLTLCEKDEAFLLNNKVRNQHIINQIVVPKYRLASEITELLRGDALDSVLQTQLEFGLNEKVPILKRIKALAEWYNEGALSLILVKKYHHILVDDLDELEEFFLFLEKISEFISKDRAIHYLELGLYDVFEEEDFEVLLHVEQILYDVSDDMVDSVKEYIQIMKTPAASKTLITNRRLSECFSKFARSLDLLIQNSDLLELKKYLSKLKQFQEGFTKLYEEYERKNPSLPTQKPYKAIEFIRPYSKVYFLIESEILLRMSMTVVEKSQSHFADSLDDAPALSEAADQSQKRLDLIKRASSQPQDLTEVIGKLLPLEQSHVSELERYLNKKS